MKSSKAKALQDATASISAARFNWLSTMYFCEFFCKKIIDGKQLPIPGNLNIEYGLKEVKRSFSMEHIISSYQLGHLLKGTNGKSYDRGEISRAGLQFFLKGALLLHVFSVLDDQKIESRFKRLWHDDNTVFTFLEQARHCIVHAEWKMTIKDRELQVEWDGVTIKYDPNERLFLANHQCLKLVDEILTRLVEELLRDGEPLDRVTCFYSVHLPPVREFLEKYPSIIKYVEDSWGIPLPDLAGLKSYT